MTVLARVLKTIMKFAKGNAKLGKKCLVVSRAVGDTCPSDCFYLHNGCYAESLEKQYPGVRPAGKANEVVKWQSIYSLLQSALGSGISIRIHERGDFGWNDKIDPKYVYAWRKALSEVLKDSGKLPLVWFYTHFYSKVLSRLGDDFPTVSAYASVHNVEHIKKAKRAGFKLFAYCTTIRKKKGGSKDFPVKIHLPILGETYVCPEQRMGRERVTCTGGDGKTACTLCVRGFSNIAFLDH